MKIPKVNKTELAKRAVSAVVGFGVTRIVYGIVYNNTAPSKVTDRVAIATGSAVLGGMVSDAASEYTDAKIDELVEMVQTLRYRSDEEAPVVITSMED